MEDFDFNNYYAKGNTIWFVNVSGGYLKTKQIVELRLRTIYPDMMVGVIENSTCVVVDKNDVDRIFTNYVDAKQCFDGLEGYEAA